MKKVFVGLLAVLCCFAMAGCGARAPFDLSRTASIEIHAYDNDSSEPSAKVVVDGEEDVSAVVENFTSLSLEKMDNVEPSIAGYDLYFRDAAGTQLAKLCLPYGPTPWVVCGSDAYAVREGGVDVDLLAQLVEVAVSSGPAPAPGSTDRGGRPYAAYIGDYVTKAEITHILSGQTREWTAEGDELDALRDWAAGLEYEHKTYEEGQSPGDADGGEVYDFVLTEGDYPGFSYIINGLEGCHLLIEGEWYSVTNPSTPPVETPNGIQTKGTPLNPETLKSPPVLTVVDQRDGKQTTALTCTASWMYPNGDGTSTGINACGAGPLDSREYIPALDANGATVELAFSITPDELSVRCWSADCWGSYTAEGEDVPVNGTELDLRPSSHIYEVTAKWDSSQEWGGSVWYAFYSGPDHELTESPSKNIPD